MSSGRHLKKWIPIRHRAQTDCLLNFTIFLEWWLPTFFLVQSSMLIKQGSYPYLRGAGSLNLFQKDTEPYLFKNWYPVSLLNCDYKLELLKLSLIASNKYFLNLLKTIRPASLKVDLSGTLDFLPSVINFTTAKNIPGLLVFLDIDTVAWSFVHFNFGWINFFYNAWEPASWTMAELVIFSS